MYKNLGKRALSILLCLVMLLAYLPAGILVQVNAAGEQSGILSSELVADPSTLNAWRDTAFNPSDLTTEHAGGVWTDKTVLKPGDIAAAFPGVPGLSVGNNNFLVALSALGANSVIVGKDATPTDVVFVLDVSNSMENTDLNAMVEAVNDSIHTLLTANSSNRVGVVVYGTDSDVLLPLDRYTPVTKGGSNNPTTAYIEMANNYGTIQVARTGSFWSGYTYVTNSAGQNVTTSLSASGATYMQSGLWQAYEMFEAANVSGTRTPALVLMSDGAPTYADTDYNNVGNSNVGNGTVNSITDGVAFLTQLTAAYVKEKIADKYNSTAYFYSVGLGVEEDGNDVSIAEAVLDTSRTRQTPESNWSTFLGLANQTNKTMSFLGTSSNVTVRYDSVITAASKNYTNKYFSAEDASQLGEAFKGIVNEISLKASYNVTRVETNNANTGGYVTFVDEIGSGMQVKEIKGILIGDTLFTGAKLVQALLNQEFGTAEEPTILGDNMVWALKERLGVKDKVVGGVTVTATEQIHDLIRKAYNSGQIAYNAQTGEFSNFICWFGDANGDYLGFWDYADPNCAIPEGAVYANSCYGMLGTTTESQTAHASDMMYVAVQVSKAITDGKIEASTPELVTFRIPASLLPTVTYQIEVEAGEDEEITEQTPAKLTYNAAEPIRLLYEVGVHSELTPLNIKDFLREGYASKDANGNYYLYTNAWYWEPSTGVADPLNPPTKENAIGQDVLYDTSKNHITYSYFEPSAQNEHYYFTEDTALYTRSGNTYEKLTTVPATDGSVEYYFQHKTFTANAAQTGVEVTAEVDIHYGKVEPKALAHAVRGDDGVYYIKEGTMHYGTIHDHDKLKTDNVTGSFKYRMHQLVDIAITGGVDSHHYEIMYLGNNGRITYAPAQGLKISKVMNDGSKPDISFTFEVALEAPDGQTLASTYETVHVAADGAETKGSVGVSAEGKLSVSLKPGESIYILGLTAGTEYTVTETKQDGYRLQDKQSDTGIIDENAIDESLFTNAVQEYGALTVTKLVTYADNLAPTTDTNKFPVTVTLKDGTENFTGTVQLDGVDYVVNDGTVTFDITHTGRKVITKIPVGVTYTVAEGTLPAGYTWTNAGVAALTGAVDMDGEIVHLENAYDPESLTLTGEAAIEVTKLYRHVADNTDTYQFDFELQRLTGNTWPKIKGASVVYENPDRGDHTKKATLDLSGEEFTAADEYFFRIAEVIPPTQTPGMTYDRTHHDFKVIVTDENLDGQLELKSIEAIDATVTAEKNPQTGVWEIGGQFTNTYETNSTKLTLAAKKTLTGAALKDGQFTFALYKTGDNFDITGITPITAKNGANGDIIFTTEPYPFSSGITNYYYVMKELTDDGNGVTVDKSVWEIVVAVEGSVSGDAQIKEIQYRKQGETQWSGSITGAPEKNIFNSITFNNTYEAAAGTLELGGNKTLTNVTPGIRETDKVMDVPANTYKFKLEAITPNAPMPGSAEATATADGVFSFDDISYSEADRTYEYKVAEINTNVAGVTYDTTVYTVKVDVTDNGVGQLIATPTYWIGNEQALGITFNNTYKAEATAQFNIYATKELNVGAGFNRDLKANDFRATLTHPDGTTETVFNDASGKFNFAPVSFDTVGSYTYSVSELVPHSAVNGKLDGVTYDTQAKAFTVEVTDGGNGKLVAKIDGAELTDGTKVAEITNSYAADSVTVRLAANKDLVGRDLNENEFTFKVEAITSGAPMPTATTAKNNKNGDVDFGNITYSAVGTYKYKVTELVPAEAVNNVLNGVTYSEKTYTVTVEVTDLGNGRLHATVSSLDEENLAQPGGIVFTNIYKAKPVDAKIEATKELYDLTGGRNVQLTVPADTYQFQLEAVDNAPMPGTDKVYAAQGGAISFDGIVYNAPGIYRYTLTEVDLNKGGIDYDDTVYTVEVTVEDNLRGALEIESIRYIKNQTGYPVAVFTNNYEADSIGAKLEANKVLINRTPGAAQTNMSVPAQTFKFKLEALDNAPTPLNTEVYAAAGGAVTFGEVVYTKAGTYRYTIQEIDMQVPGVDTDETVYTATVIIGDDGNGKLYVEGISYAIGQTPATAAVFENIYTASSVTIHVEGDSAVTDGKILTDESSLPENKKDLDDYEFRFTLSEVGGNDIQTVVDNGQGFRFDALTFDTVGQYQYLIFERPGNDTGIVYDYAKYLVTVTVTDNGNGALQADVKYEKASSPESDDYTEVEGILFQNSYKAKETAVIFSGTKTLTGGRKLKADEFSFQLKDLRSGEVLGTVKNDAAGAFTFPEIVYNAEGTYTYLLVEKDEGTKGITYDTTQYTLTVTVKDVAGQLKATTVITKGTAVAETAGFTNIFTPDAVVTTIRVQKELVNKSEEQMGLNGFKFQLETDGMKQIITTDDSGKAEIPLTFTAENVGKTYTFKLSEVVGDTEHMTYDSTVYEISVTVTQGEDGQLQLVVEREGTGDFTFVNTYEPPVPEEPTEPSVPVEPSQPNEEPPKTSDNMNLGLTAGLMLSSVACLFVLVISRKRSAG